MARNERYVPEIIKAGLLEPTVQLLWQPSEEAQGASLRALRNITGHLASVPTVIRAGVLPLLIPLLSSPTSLRANAAAILACISLHQDSIPHVVEAQALPALVLMISSQTCRAYERDTLEFALMAIQFLTQTVSARELVAAAGAIPSLVDLMADFEVNIATLAGAAICNLVYQTGLPARVSATNVVPALARHLHLASAGGIEMAAVSIIALCGEVPSMRGKLMEAGCLDRLVQLLDHSDDGVKTHAAQALNQIANIIDLPVYEPKLTQAVLDAGAMQPLVKLLDSASVNASSSAALCMLSILENPATRKAVIGSGAVPALTRLLKSSHPETLIYTAGAMRYLTLDEAGLRLVRDAQVLDRLKELKESPDLSVRSEASAAILNLTAEDR